MQTGTERYCFVPVFFEPLLLAAEKMRRFRDLRKERSADDRKESE
jgi:hypothetical protein